MIFGLNRSEMLRHVKLLERAHLIAAQGIGQQRRYRFVGELLPFYQRLIDFIISLEDLDDQSFEQIQAPVADQLLNRDV